MYGGKQEKEKKLRLKPKINLYDWVEEHGLRTRQLFNVDKHEAPSGPRASTLPLKHEDQIAIHLFIH